VDEAYRHQGVGARLIKMIEETALSKGITKSHLETTSFQALDFYRKQGYVIFGHLDDKPIGHTWYYMKKEVLVSETTKPVEP
jgi:GNAT superfamily N-acetyltransferase